MKRRTRIHQSRGQVTHSTTPPIPEQEEVLGRQPMPAQNPSRQLTPSAILQLQRSHGNQYVQHLIDGSESSSIQRAVYDVRGRPVTDVWLFNRFKTSESESYKKAQALRISDQQILDICRFYTQGADRYYISDVFDHIEQIIKERAARGTGASSPGQSHGVTVHIKDISAVFPKGLNVNVNKGNSHSINTNRMSINANLLATGPLGEINRWSVGFIQTVASLERTVKYKQDISGQEAVWRTYMDGSRRDGPSGYGGPWYDPNSFTTLTNKESQRQRVEIQDQPGFNWAFPPNHTITNVSGRDEFKTWLIMRRDDGTVKYIRMWFWHVDYTASENASRLGISFDGFAPAPTGREAVLDGNVAKDDLQSEVRRLPKTTFTMTFDEMKRL